MSTQTLTLRAPIEINGETIIELQVRCPRVRDRLAAEKGNGSAAEKEVTFLAHLCEVAPTTIGELALADYLKLQEMVTSFLS